MEGNHHYNKKLNHLAKSLRRGSTKGEVRLWCEVLRAKKMHGYSFNRQRPVLGYIVDFMCKELKLIIEIDGYSHREEDRYLHDLKRQRELEEHGYTVLRFEESQVILELDYVEAEISGWIVRRHDPDGSG